MGIPVWGIFMPGGCCWSVCAPWGPENKKAFKRTPINLYYTLDSNKIRRLHKDCACSHDIAFRISFDGEQSYSHAFCTQAISRSLVWLPRVMVVAEPGISTHQPCPTRRPTLAIRKLQCLWKECRYFNIRIIVKLCFFSIQWYLTLFK